MSKKILFTCITIFFFAALTEAVCYLNYYEPVIPIEITTHHPDLGRSYHKNSSAISTRTGENIEYAIDKYGSRSSQHTENGEVDCTIAALGDSETFGHGLAIEDVWTAMLNKKHPKLKIYNFAVIGYGIDQAILRYEVDANKVSPKLVIINLPHLRKNRHMHKAIFGYYKPLFKFNEISNSFDIETKHIVEPYKHRFYNTVPRFLKQSYTVKVIWMALAKFEHFKLQQPLYLSQLGFSDKESMDKAIHLLEDFEKRINKDDVTLLTTTSLNELCEDANLKHCLYLPRKKDHRLISKLGEDLHHPNRMANKDRSDWIDSYILKHQLLGTNCL